MTRMWKTYTTELRSLLDTVSENIGHLQKLKGEERSSVLKQMDRDFEEAEDMLSKMKLEVNQAAVDMRPTLQANVKEFTNEIGRLRQDRKRGESAYATTSARADLFGGIAPSLADNPSTRDARTRMMNQTDQLTGQGSQIQEMVRLVDETEQVAVSTLTTMHGQREQIIGSMNRVKGLDDAISRAKGLLSTIGNRMQTNKCIMAIIIVVLLGIIGVIIWLVIPTPENPFNITYIGEKTSELVWNPEVDLDNYR